MLFSGGNVTDLGVIAPNAHGSRALALGPGGKVYGYSVPADPFGEIEPAVFSGGSVAELPLPPGDSEGAAFGANSSSQVVGYTEAGNGADASNRPHGSHAVLFSGGTATLLGALPGDSQSAASGINDAGQAVGYSQGARRQHAVLFAGGGVTDLGALPGDTDSAAFSVNATGVAVGYSAGAGRFRAVAFKDGTVIALGTVKNLPNAQALSIDKEGIAVGTADADGFNHHAVVFVGAKAYDMNAYLPAGSGWTLESANAINDSGQVVGEGIHNGQTRAFLVSPAPQQPPPSGGPPPRDESAAPSLAASAPTITVHYDYMVLPGPDGHSDAPAPAAIQTVADAFAAHGIQLVVQPVHAAIPEREVIAFGVSLDPNVNGPDAASFDTLKATYFPNAPPGVHYSIFGFFSDCDSPTHCDAAPTGPGSRIGTPVFGQTGRAELPGSNFVVSLGHFLRELGAAPTIFNVGGTFMHELGHNLGLHHGGGFGPEPCNPPSCEDGPNYKPNYLSVMNYEYQFAGIPFATAPGSSTIAGFRLDYSEQVLPTGGNTPGALDENANLNEPAGLGSGTSDIFAFTDGQCAFLVAATNGPVDWNGNGVATDTNATADLNPSDHPFSACSVTNQILRGHEDWTAILASLQAHPNGLQVARPAMPTEAASDPLSAAAARLTAQAPSRRRS